MMRCYLQLILTLLSLVNFAAEAANSVEEQTDAWAMWEAFKIRYNRTYTTQQEASRFEIFSSNLNEIKALNDGAAGLDIKYGVTRFSDLKKNEFREKFLTFNANGPIIGAKDTSLLDCSPSYSSMDWSEIYTTAVKDQADCGSCWSFATAEQVESDTMRLYGMELTLSEQQLLDCDYSNAGCTGGYYFNAFGYLQTAYLESESTYPYTSGWTGATSYCQYNSYYGLVAVYDYFAVYGEACMAAQVLQYGPIAAAIFADNIQYYSGGIITAASCGSGTVNHAIQIVGVDTVNGYWIIRNSWGANWGDNGYGYIEYGTNACNIGDYPGGYTTTVASPAWAPTSFPVSSAMKTDRHCSIIVPLLLSLALWFSSDILLLFVEKLL